MSVRLGNQGFYHHVSVHMFFVLMTSMSPKDIDAHTTLYLSESYPGHFDFANALPMANLIYPLS